MLKIWTTSSVVCPQFPGHAGVGQDTLVAVTFPAGSSSAASLTAHPRRREGDFCAAILSARPSLLEDVIFRGACLFCAIGQGGGF